MDQIIDRLKIDMPDLDLLRISHEQRSKLALLPNLSDLRFGIHNPVDAPILHLLMGSRLRRLHLCWWRTNFDGSPFRDAISRHSSQIRTLDLHFWDPARDIDSGDLVNLMPSLTQLTVGGEHGTMTKLVRKMAHTDALCSVTVTEGEEVEEEPDYGVRHEFDCYSFKSLEYVSTTYHSTSTIIYPPQLGQRLRCLVVTVNLARIELSSAVSRLLRLVGYSCHNLTSFTVYIHAKEDRDVPGYPVVLPKSTTPPATVALSPLFALTKLSVLSIYDCSNSMIPWLEEVEKTRVATSWRNLSSFEWQSHVIGTPINLAMLGVFARCESLRYLALPLDPCVAVEDTTATFKHSIILDVACWIVADTTAKEMAMSLMRLEVDNDGPLTISCGLETDYRLQLFWISVEYEVTLLSVGRRRCCYT